MTLRSDVVWFFVVIWAGSLNRAESGGGPKELCKGDNSLGFWQGGSVDIPGEASPDDKLAVRIRCQEASNGERFFDRCEATLDGVKQEFPTGERSHAFVGKSGKRHALLCPQDAQPSIVQPFAPEVCKKGKATTACTQRPTYGSGDRVSLEKMNVAFKCNDEKTQIVSCKADGQTEWAKAEEGPAYFGGKSGHLNSIECMAHDPPDITVGYARDICHVDGQKDEIQIQGESKSVKVFFECNTKNDAFVRCFPIKKGDANAIDLGRVTEFDKPVIGKKHKKITCRRNAKPEISTFVVEPKVVYMRD